MTPIGDISKYYLRDVQKYILSWQFKEVKENFPEGGGHTIVTNTYHDRVEGSSWVRSKR